MPSTHTWKVVYTCPHRAYEDGISAYTTYLLRALEKRGWKMHNRLRNRGTGFWARKYELLRRLIYFSTRGKFDLYFAPDHRFPLFLPRQVAKVVTVHDMSYFRYPETMSKRTWLYERFFFSRTLRRADRILAVSKSTARDIVQYFPEAQKKIRVVPSAAVAEKKTSKASLPHGISRPYILFVGTLEPRKNLPRLITAYARLPQNLREKNQLVLCGRVGWGDVDLRKAVEKYGLEKKVILTGYVLHDDLVNLYAQARCLVMPSLYEGFGLPLLNAQTFGIPVLTSRTSSMPEVAGKGAIYVDPFDITSIAHGLQTLLKDQKIWETLSHAALENARKYTWDQTARRTIEVFKEALTARDQRMKKKTAST